MGVSSDVEEITSLLEELELITLLTDELTLLDEETELIELTILLATDDTLDDWVDELSELDRLPKQPAKVDTKPRARICFFIGSLLTYILGVKTTCFARGSDNITETFQSHKFVKMPQIRLFTRE